MSGQIAVDAFARYLSSVFQAGQLHLDPTDTARAAHSQVNARDIAALSMSGADFKAAVKRLKTQSPGASDGVPVFLAKDWVSVLCHRCFTSMISV